MALAGIASMLSELMRRLVLEGLMATGENYLYVFPGDVQRVKAFSDNIFSFSMTLLVAIITLPQAASGVSEAALSRELLSHWRDYWIYLISFLNISNYWMAHYSIFANIIRSDRGLVSLNMFLLLTSTFLPFPAHLMGQYGRIPVVALLYGITITMSYLFLMLIVLYAYSDNRLTRPGIHLPIKRIVLMRMCIPLAFAILGTLLAFYYTRLSFLFFTVVSVFNILPLKLFLRGVDVVHPIAPEDK
jgi:uncharacterized membrane protein